MNRKQIIKIIISVLLAALTALGAAFGLSSCNVTRTITTKSEYWQKADTSVVIQTKTIEIAQKPHMTMQIREVSPTCDKEGVGSYWTCGTCDGIFEDEAATRPLEEPPVLPKLPHTPGEPVTENETAATCTASGSYDTVVYCFACGAEDRTAFAVPPLNTRITFPLLFVPPAFTV